MIGAFVRGLSMREVESLCEEAGLGIEQCWPASDRQRCCVHRARNLYAKLPDRERERVKQAYWRALDEAINERDAKQRLQALVDELDKGGFTAAARCLADDLDALVVHLRYPTRHRRRWRSTNLLERSLGEVKRRTKVMGRFPGEDSCLTLVWAVLDLLISHETNGIRFTQLDRQHLNRVKYQPPALPATTEMGYLSNSGRLAECRKRARTTQARTRSCLRGSRTSLLAWTTWNGCAGRTGSAARGASAGPAGS